MHRKQKYTVIWAKNHDFEKLKKTMPAGYLISFSQITYKIFLIEKGIRGSYLNVLRVLHRI